MVEPTSSITSVIGTLSGLLAVPFVIAPIAQVVAPDLGASLVGAGPLGLAFGVVGWVLLVYVPASEKRHADDMEKERKENAAEKELLNARITALELRIDEQNKNH